MAETYEDYGDYSEELLYRERSVWGKIFSFRTLKKIFKTIWVLIVLLVYGLLFFRLCSGGPPKALSGILWTKELYEAYAEDGSLLVYEQTPVQTVADDGYFAIYNVLYFPESDVLQLTVRYNNSTVEKLREELISEREEALRAEISASIAAENPALSKKELQAATEEALAEKLAAEPITIELSERPFVFLLRDDTGKVYTSYAYIESSKNVYQYARLSFEGVHLLGTEQSTPEKDYPTPETPVAGYLYRGVGAAESDAIEYLYLDMYYEEAVDTDGESFAYPLQVYYSGYALDVYDIEAPTGVAEDILRKSLTDTVEP